MKKLLPNVTFPDRWMREIFVGISGFEGLG